MGAESGYSSEDLDARSQSVPLIVEAEGNVTVSRDGNLSSEYQFQPSDSPEPEIDCGPLSSNMKKAKAIIFAATSPIPFHHVTLTNLKLVAFATIVIFILCRGIQSNAESNDSCTWLLTSGRIQGSLWQPDGCMAHNYSPIDARNCIRQRKDKSKSFIFIGDSRIRFLFNQTVLHLTGNAPVFPAGKHSNITVDDTSVSLSLQFYWSPLVNVSMRNLVEQLTVNRDDLPGLIVLAAATWHMKLSNASKEALEDFKSNLESLSVVLDEVGKRTTVIWVSQDPVYENLLSSARWMITNSEISKYNSVAEEILDKTSVKIWRSNQWVFWASGDSYDGLHQGNRSLYHNLQILLNFHCNREMRFRDATCCVSPPAITTSQILTVGVFGVFTLLASLVVIRQYGYTVMRQIQWKLKRQPAYVNGSLSTNTQITIKDAKVPRKVKTRPEMLKETVIAIAKLGLIMGYFFLCDRTDFFMKENKYYSHINFFVPLVYIFLIGTFFSEKSGQNSLLHRDQTDDWKGWMQFVILVYHYTAGSTRLPIYMCMRVLVSSYLFLNGYAHFMYFWGKGDFSAYRFCQIVFRMNLLVICLCLVMGQSYQFYYFVPLVTFWFILTYLTMSLPPTVTQTSASTYTRHNLYLILKFVALFGLITTLHLSQAFFEQIFTLWPWKPLFVLNGSSYEWFFRWKLDRYSVLGGMVFGYLVSLSRKHGWLNEGQGDNLFDMTKKNLAALALGISGLMGYLIFAMSCRNKTECNEVHTYIVFIPILGFILVRNTFAVVRRRFSTIFAWAGKISLELFIVQFHVWLAADTYGILVMIPGYPMLNVMFTSFIFIAVAHEVNSVTGVLADNLLSQDWKFLLLFIASFGLFLAILVLFY